jgi:hypothetical protein
MPSIELMKIWLRKSKKKNKSKNNSKVEYLKGW